MFGFFSKLRFFKKTEKAVQEAAEKAVEAEKKLEEKAVEIEHNLEDTVVAAEEKVEEVVHRAEDVLVSSERRVLYAMREFLRLEAAGGIFLVLAAFAALIVANSPLFDIYHYFLERVQFRIGFSDIGMSFDAEIRKSILLWINDGLMAIFFFLVGLEIKREICAGELSSRARVILPAAGALGGMIVPALIFFMLNRDNPEGLDGWAIPMATDIAFALGVIALLGNRLPSSIKVLLTAIAIVDDLGAILIIALFYSKGIALTPLYIAALAVFVLFMLSLNNVKRIAPYILTGIVLWAAVLESGIHATLAGVLTALFIPLKPKTEGGRSPLKNLEHNLHPWIAFGVLPLFAFANAGVPLMGLTGADLVNPVTLGIIAGLFIGKQVGVFIPLWLAIKTGLSPMPERATWTQIYAVAVLCGIGFTMSLFIGSLSYEDLALQASVRIGVLSASVLSAVVGFLLLYSGVNKQKVRKDARE